MGIELESRRSERAGGFTALAILGILPAHVLSGVFLMVAFLVDLGGAPWCALVVIHELRGDRR